MPGWVITKPTIMSFHYQEYVGLCVIGMPAFGGSQAVQIRSGLSRRIAGGSERLRGGPGLRRLVGHGPGAERSRETCGKDMLESGPDALVDQADIPAVLLDCPPNERFGVVNCSDTSSALLKANCASFRSSEFACRAEPPRNPHSKPGTQHLSNTKPETKVYQATHHTSPALPCPAPASHRGTVVEGLGLPDL